MRRDGHSVVDGAVASARRPSGPARSPHPRTGREGDAGTGQTTRGQANLLALVAALFALTTATVVGVAVADGALAGATRDPGQRHAATAVAARMVAADSPLTNRTNVLSGPAIDEFSVPQLRSRYPVLDGRSVRVTLDDDVLASSGTPAGGTTARRIVLVERTRVVTFRPGFTGGNTATLPQRTSRLVVEIDAPTNRSVETVRAAGRTVLHDSDGALGGSYTVSVSRRETVRLTFVANGSLRRGDVSIALFPRDTRKAVLAVTVDE